MTSSATAHDIFAKARRAPALAKLLDHLEKPSIARDFMLREVHQAAWSFLCATILSTQQKKRPIWIVSPHIKSQEHHFEELRSWFPEVVFFPNLEVSEEGIGLPDPELLSERLAVLGRLAQGEIITTVLSREAFHQFVPTSQKLQQGLIKIAVAQRASPTEIMEQLLKLGFSRTSQVGSRGELALRGGILDLFPWQSNLPYRIEFDDIEIVSIRTFDPHSQRSIAEEQVCSIQSAEIEKGTTPLSSFIGKEDLLLLLGDDTEEKEIFENIVATKIYITDNLEAPLKMRSRKSSSLEVACYPLPFASFGAGDFVMQEAKREEFFKQLSNWQEQSYDIIFSSSTEGEQERFLELLEKRGVLSKENRVAFHLGELKNGFSFPEASLVFLSDAEIFGRSASSQWKRFHRREEESRRMRSALDFTEFSEGDFLVHLDYGIGLYEGMQLLPALDGSSSEVLVLQFDQEARLFVPLEEAWKVSRYVGVGKYIPNLSSLNNEKWKKTRAAAEKSIFLYAGKLLKLQAERQTQLGHAFSPDTAWQREFEASFPYRETEDQLRAVAEIKADMESVEPMDRLLCGDVGFGKTEVALRAAFKALMDGKQVLLLAPTTVLAQQHYQTVRERMSAYPVKIELLSRYRSAAEQRQVVKALAEGSLDLVVGTHRLLSPDITFKNLGLVIVDEEQRFGVKHKEAFKERFHLVDMLTLSATPIPRTLYLSLMGARKMSLLQTPPSNRQPIETLVLAYDERLIRHAIERELARGGQVYFLHNRITSIEKVASRLQELLPKARIAWGHGQMEEKDLEEIMQRFVAGDLDVLVSTTIIESGLDIPNANTMIIDRADRFGLADLYQLRGRVGRSENKAYAYLLLPRSLMIQGEARRRVQAIKEYSELGSGFKIAMRDLEIRGAGNLLGTAQSGHISAVGFDFYCKMLHQAINQLKGEESSISLSRKEVVLHLDFVISSSSAWNQAIRMHVQREKEEGKKFLQPNLPAFLPEDYFPEVTMRMEGYRHLAIVADDRAIEELEASWRDRFGPIPAPVAHLLIVEKIRAAASACGITRVETRGPKLMLTRGGDFILLGHQFPRLKNMKAEAKLGEILCFLQSLRR